MYVLCPVVSRQTDCDFVWSTNDHSVAIQATPFDGEVADDALPSMMTRHNIAGWTVVHVLDIAKQSLEIVAPTPPASAWNDVLFLGTLMFSNNCRYSYTHNVIAWHALLLSKYWCADHMGCLFRHRQLHGIPEEGSAQYHL